MINSLLKTIFKTTFANLSIISEYGNPFDREPQYLYSFNTREATDKPVEISIAQLLTTRRKQEEQFLKKLTTA